MKNILFLIRTEVEQQFWKFPAFLWFPMSFLRFLGSFKTLTLETALKGATYVHHRQNSAPPPPLLNDFRPTKKLNIEKENKRKNNRKKGLLFEKQLSIVFWLPLNFFSPKANLHKLFNFFTSNRLNLLN